MVGVGSDNSRGLYDNIKIPKLPAQIEFEHQDDFSDGHAELFGGFATGDWDVTAEQYGGTPTGGTGLAVSLVDLGLGHGLQTNSYLELSAKVTAANFSGVVFDQYSPDFKFVALDAEQDQVVIGHRTARGWFLDLVFSKSIEVGVSYHLTVILKGTTVSVTLDKQVLASKVFNAVVVDGSFGLITARGPALSMM